MRQEVVVFYHGADSPKDCWEGTAVVPAARSDEFCVALQKIGFDVAIVVPDLAVFDRLRLWVVEKLLGLA